MKRAYYSDSIDNFRKARPEEVKIKKAEEIIAALMQQEKKEDDPIVRLHKGRIRNFGVSMEQKIKELEQRRAVSVGFNLIAGGVVEIV